MASLECFKPLRALGGLFHISMKGNVELDNIYKLLDYPEQEKNNDITLTPGKNIVLSNVGFSYGDNTTLEDINMIIKPGTKTALLEKVVAENLHLLNLSLVYTLIIQGILNTILMILMQSLLTKC